VDPRAGRLEALRRVTDARMSSCGLVPLIGLRLIVPAWSADEPTLKATLDQVQSDAESKAVENLIEKLNGAGAQPANTTSIGIARTARRPRPYRLRHPPHCRQARPGGQARRERRGARHRSGDILRLQIG
jgi:hypothetical protein